MLHPWTPYICLYMHVGMLCMDFYDVYICMYMGMNNDVWNAFFFWSGCNFDDTIHPRCWRGCEKVDRASYAERKCRQHYLYCCTLQQCPNRINVFIVSFSKLSYLESGSIGECLYLYMYEQKSQVSYLILNKQVTAA